MAAAISSPAPAMLRRRHAVESSTPVEYARKDELDPKGKPFALTRADHEIPGT
ncbi:hypothetical protein [Streptomyces sp. NPDC058045]|uniref:hypothetical protein n=1 Tax=Streptomyces sp. NPDC058045 TaxID=3346311 RepID=UPI0036E5B067